MAIKGYPVMDYVECVECGICIEKCPHGVYDTSKTPSPIVKYPEACIDHCHGCGNLYPVGAITYVGDDTGWLPPKGNPTSIETGCSCSRIEASNKRIVVEYLYLDLQTCDRCIGTDNILDEVMMVLTPALKLAGYEIEYNKIEIKTEELARKHQFLSSPTIRVSGNDVCQAVAENSCGCCSENSGTDVNCRVFEYQGETYEIPPQEMLAEAILKEVFSMLDAGSDCSEYQLPENLKTFFEGKSSKDSDECSCGGNCC